MRKSRNRRGLKRRVRKNKTMRGGVVPGKLGFVTLDEFKNSGYGYAKSAIQTLTAIPTTADEIASKPLKIAKTFEDYNKFYYDHPFITITKYEPSTSSPTGAIQTQTRDQIGLVEPELFKECIEYITSDSINKKRFGATTTKNNQNYVNFARSFKMFTGDSIDGYTGSSLKPENKKVLDPPGDTGTTAASPVQAVQAPPPVPSTNGFGVGF